jgi:hypothetical protein
MGHCRHFAVSCSGTHAICTLACMRNATACYLHSSRCPSKPHPPTNTHTVQDAQAQASSLITAALTDHALHTYSSPTGAPSFRESLAPINMPLLLLLPNPTLPPVLLVLDP